MSKQRSRKKLTRKEKAKRNEEKQNDRTIRTRVSREFEELGREAELAAKKMQDLGLVLPDDSEKEKYGKAG